MNELSITELATVGGGFTDTRPASLGASEGTRPASTSVDGTRPAA